MFAEFSQKLLIFQTDLLRKIQQNIANVAKSAKICQLSKISARYLVDFEKCCKTRIYLKRSATIQPKTSEILPKNWQLPYGSTTLRLAGRRRRRRTGRAARAALQQAADEAAEHEGPHRPHPVVPGPLACRPSPGGSAKIESENKK